MGSEIQKEKLVVYTAIFGDYDLLMEPKGVPDEVDLVCFTDNSNLQSNKWEIRVVSEELTPAMSNRKIKILPHRYFSDYDYSIYVDGNVHIVDDVSELASKYLSKYQLVVPPHPKRDCVYDEAEVCIQSGKADEKPIREMMNRYSADGFPQNFGLSENNVILREHHDDDVQGLMNEWWEEVRNGPGRDQLSLPYVLWRNEHKLHKLDFVPRIHGQYFIFYPHRESGTKLFWIPYIRITTRFSKPVERRISRLIGDAVHAQRSGGISELANKTVRILLEKVSPR